MVLLGVKIYNISEPLLLGVVVLSPDRRQDTGLRRVVCEWARGQVGHVKIKLKV